MIYISTNELGFDQYSLGFPSVRTCQAIVYRTDFGLFGFHDAYGEVRTFKAKCKTFNQFVQNLSQNHETQAQALICVIHRTTRFNTDTAGDQSEETWKNQVSMVADALTYKGPIWGARLMKHTDKTDGSAYIRFDIRDNGAPPCRVRFKRWSKMEFNDAIIPADQSVHAQLGMDQKGAKTVEEIKWTLNDVVQPHKAVRRKGRDDEGGMNEVTSFVRLN